jgi:hypothetical protein
MNILKTITTTAALVLLGTTAQAAVVCDHCEYVYYGSYLGAYWPGDNGTFKNTRIVADMVAQLGPGMGNNRQFDNYWVFDLPAGGSVAMVFNTAAATRLQPSWSIQVFDDAGTLCNATACQVIAYNENVGRAILWGLATKFTVNTVTLPAGRYVIRLAGGTRATGESAYTGSLTVKP